VPRINPPTAEQLDPKAAEMLDQFEKSAGMKPNILRTIAHSPAALQAFMSFHQALNNTSIAAPLREQVALAVSGANGCDYCAAAHTAAARSQGVTQDETRRNLAGRSDDPTTHAAVEFARTIVRKRGWIDDQDLQAVRDAGYDDQQIVEIIAVVGLFMFTTYFNHIAQPEVDFPPVELPAEAANA
jgi:uncharacterized peroxidase-related enzyme